MRSRRSRPVLLIEMVTAHQPGIVAVADGVDIFRNAKPGQMFAQQRQKARSFHNPAADQNRLRVE